MHTKRLKHLTLEQVVELFDPKHHDTVKEISGLRGTDGLVVFENRIEGSPQLGKKTVLAVGPQHTHKTVAEFDGAWLGEGHSRQDAIAFCLMLPELSGSEL